MPLSAKPSSGKARFRCRALKGMSSNWKLAWVTFCLAAVGLANQGKATPGFETRGKQLPIGPEGRKVGYQLETKSTARDSVVKSFTVSLGPVEKIGEVPHQWLGLEATKVNGEQF